MDALLRKLSANPSLAPSTPVLLPPVFDLPPYDNTIPWIACDKLVMTEDKYLVIGVPKHVDNLVFLQ